MMVLLMIISLFVFLLIGMPIALALGIPSLVYIILDPTVPNFTAIQTIVGGANSYPILAIPFFIFAGNLMNVCGVTSRIFDFSKKLIGHIRGGLGHVNVLASIIFAGMSGAAVADAGGLGLIEIQEMRKAGYDDRITLGVTAASSTIGPIIPPSMAIVMYGVVSSSSIGRLFAAGIIPGIIMGLSLMVMIYFLADRYKAPILKRAKFHEIVRSFLSAFWSLLTPLIILGGIFFGIFTPTEAAIIACIYALILGFFVYKEMTWKILYETIRASIFTIIQLMFIITAATLFAYILAKEEVPTMLALFMLKNVNSAFLTIVMINLLLLIVGCFMETVAAINILVPVLLPLVTTLGIDPIHFGIIMIINLMIGLITPPFGTVLFVIAGVAKVPVEKVTQSTAIFILPLLVTLIFLIIFPQLSLFLPNLIFGV